jgi:hypothetical protein
MTSAIGGNTVNACTIGTAIATCGVGVDVLADDIITVIITSNGILFDVVVMAAMAVMVVVDVIIDIHLVTVTNLPIGLRSYI